MPLDLFIQGITASPPTRVEGTAVFLTSAPNSVPHALLHNLKHNKVLHERVVLLTLVTRDIPYGAGRRALRNHAAGLRVLPGRRRLRLQGRPGRAGAARRSAAAAASSFDMMETSFFVSRETLIATVAPGMALWRERLFVSMSKNATKASDFFRIPSNRVVELGTQVEL